MSTLPAVQEQQGLSRLDPQALLAKAIEAGTSVEAIEKLVDLAIRMRDVQAKEAYSASLAAFQKACSMSRNPWLTRTGSRSPGGRAPTRRQRMPDACSGMRSVTRKRATRSASRSSNRARVEQERARRSASASP